MPKIIDNYQLQSLESTCHNGIEFYKGKQIGSNKNFILKRLKTQSNMKRQPIPNPQTSLSNSVLFNKLVHQTKIIKSLSHQRIPKCHRILKTRNSVYMVYEDHPTVSLKEYLKKNSLTLTFKFQISRIILDTLSYIHASNIVYRGVNQLNIMMDATGNPYFTNFTEAELFPKNPSKDESVSIKRQEIFKRLTLQDLQASAKLFFYMFDFRKIDPKLPIFSSDAQKRLYIIVIQILKNKIGKDSFQNLLKILSQKDNLRWTDCTQSPTSIISRRSQKQQIQPLSPVSFKNSHKSSRLMQNSVRQTGHSTIKSSTIISKNNLSRSTNRQTHLRNISQKSVQRTNFKPAAISQFISLSPSANIMNKNNIDEQQKQVFAKKIQALAKNRKMLNFLFKSLAFIQKQSNLKLLFAILLKCQQIYTRMDGDLEKFKLKNIVSDKEKQFVSIVQNENFKIKKILNQIKNQVNDIIETTQQSKKKYFEQMEQLLSQNLAAQFEQRISLQISAFLQKLVQDNPQYQIAVRNQHKKSSAQEKKQLPSPTEQFGYYEIKSLYYLSIQLKYGSYDRFFDKKISPNPNKLNVMQDEYFTPFQSKSLPIVNLTEEIVLRVRKFMKKAQITTIV